MSVPRLDPRTYSYGLLLDGVVHRPVQIGVGAWSPMCERMDAIDNTRDIIHGPKPSRYVGETAFVPKVLTCLRCLTYRGGTL